MTELTRPQPSFAEAFRFWLKLGFISFGGPSGQIAIMHTELVERRKWISEERFLNALNFCMLLPGPEAQQLAVYCGRLLHRTWGGIVAGTLFVLPSAFILWALSFVYFSYGSVPWIAALFYGLKPAVVAIVAAAVVRIGRKALRNEVLGGIAAVAFTLIFFGDVPFPAIVFGAGLIGYLGSRFWPAKFAVFQGEGPEHEDGIQPRGRPSWGRAFKITALCLSLWWTPLLLVGAAHGWNGVLFQEGLFFSKASMITFGGAYAVLPYVSQQAVERFGWLNAGQMLDGLGLAESTPGPLIMVLQFVGFAGGWNQPGALSPLLAATLGSAITTWSTFVPCFLWIFLGAPHLEALRGRVRVSGALSAITAAVVGVMLNLAIWFAAQVLFPKETGFDPLAAAICLVALAGLVRLKCPVLPMVLGSAAVGLLAKWVSIPG